MADGQLAAGRPAEGSAPPGPEVRLNIGAGESRIDGFTAIDRKAGGEAFPLDYADGSIDEIRASHILEHFSHRQASEVLTHWAAKLKPGGRLRVAVPNFKWIAEQYIAGEPINVQGYVMGGHADADDHHGAIFDAELLTEMFLAAGLERIGRWQSELQDDAALAVSLNLEGYKPHAGGPRLNGVSAILSAPRFGPVMHFGVAYEAFANLGISYQIGQGAYWQQVLAELIEGQIAAGADFILTMDYDTVFTAEDVRALYRIMAGLPEVDAVCALQMKRGDDAFALLTIEGDDGKAASRIWRADLNRHAVDIQTGHFGCTLFRGSALRRLPRPWFEPRPDADGRWRGDKIDADIAFWKSWAAAGLRLCVAPQIPVGHLAEVILWPGDDLRPVYQTTGDYNEAGIPAGVMGRT